MVIKVDLNIASKSQYIPDAWYFTHWIESVLNATSHFADEISVCIVDAKESAFLNNKWRGKKGATNVLSFPINADNQLPITLLGDLVICAPIVIQEAHAQQKKIEAHWAHMVIHGTLHLLGYDHVYEKEANEMEHIEICLLAKLGYEHPY